MNRHSNLYLLIIFTAFSTVVTAQDHCENSKELSLKALLTKVPDWKSIAIVTASKGAVTTVKPLKGKFSDVASIHAKANALYYEKSSLKRNLQENQRFILIEHVREDAELIKLAEFGEQTTTVTCYDVDESNGTVIIILGDKNNKKFEKILLSDFVRVIQQVVKTEQAK